jgi:hypothetical protein
VSTNVDTSQVAAAAGRVRAVAREADVCAQGIAAVRQSLDLQIAASASIDERLRSLATSAAKQAGVLNGHAAFLSHAASRYDTAESAVRGAVPAKQGASGEARVGLFDSGQASRSGSSTEDGVRPASLNDLIRAYGAELIAADEQIQEALVDLVGAVPLLGTYLAWDEIFANVQNRDPGAAGMDLLVMIASEGVEKGFGIPGVASLISLLQSASHIAGSDQFQYALLDVLPDWAVTAITSDVSSSFVNAATGVGEGISSVAQGATEVAGEVWDWVNPW